MEITKLQSNVIPLPSADNAAPVESQEQVNSNANIVNQQEQLTTQETTETNQVDVESVAAEINSFLQNSQRSLQFRASEGVEPPVIEVYDKKTDQLIREIPSQEAQRIAEALREQIEINNGILLRLEV